MFVLQWEMLHIEGAAKIKTDISCSAIFSRKSCRLWDNVERYGGAGQATDDNVKRRRIDAIYLLDNSGKKDGHTFIIFNTYWFSTATMVTRTLLNVTLYVHYLSCLIHACKRVTQRCRSLDLSVVTAMQSAVMRRCRWSTWLTFSRYTKFMNGLTKRSARGTSLAILVAFLVVFFLPSSDLGLLTIIEAQALNNRIVTSKRDTQ
jgi:hypothetical protein